MKEGIDQLIILINQAISNKEKELEELDKNNNPSSIQIYQEIGKRLDNKVNSLIDIENDVIAEIISESSLSEEERESLYNIIIDIKENLKDTKNVLAPVEIKSINKLNKIIIETNERKLKEININNNKMSSISTKITNYLKLLGILKDNRNNLFIKDINLIKEIFSESNPQEETKRKILFAVLRYNKASYYGKMGDVYSKNVVLNIEETHQVFRIFDYDFNKLNQNEQEYLLINGNIENIKDVFRTLTKLNFPKINVSKESIKLVELLVNSDSDTITKIVNFSKPRNITPKRLLTIFPALIKPSLKKKNKNIIDVVAKSKDYINNIEYLEKKNINIEFVYEKCKEILLLPNNQLVNNYNYLTSYNIKIKEKEYGILTNPSLTCLLTNNFYEIIDKFIELSPFGYDYIIKNKENILKLSSANDNIFYNLYLYNKKNKDVGTSLKKEITKYKNSSYYNIPYKKIEKEISENIYIVDYKHKIEFQKALNKAREEKIFDLSKADKKLLSLEEFTDSKNKYRYIINNIIISKPKVKRIYNILKNYNLHEYEDSLLFSITYNTFLTEKEYNIIKKVIEDRSR